MLRSKPRIWKAQVFSYVDKSKHQANLASPDLTCFLNGHILFTSIPLVPLFAFKRGDLFELPFSPPSLIVAPAWAPNHHHCIYSLIQNTRLMAQNPSMQVYPSFTIVLAPTRDTRTHRAHALQDALETSLLPLASSEPVSCFLLFLESRI